MTISRWVNKGALGDTVSSASEDAHKYVIGGFNKALPNANYYIEGVSVVDQYPSPSLSQGIRLDANFKLLDVGRDKLSNAATAAELATSDKAYESNMELKKDYANDSFDVTYTNIFKFVVASHNTAPTVTTTALMLGHDKNGLYIYSAAASVKYVLGVPTVANDKLLFVGNRSSRE